MKFDDAVCLIGQIGVVRNHDDRLARTVEFEEDFEDLLARRGIEVPGGLVGEQDYGRIDDGPGDGDALACATRKLAWKMKDAMVESQSGQDVTGPILDLCGLSKPVGHGRTDQHGHGDIFQDCQFRQKMVELEDETEGSVSKVVAIDAWGCEDIPLSEDNGPLVGSVQRAQEVQERAFTASGGPHDGKELSFAHLEVDALQHGHLDHIEPIGFVQIIRL